MKNKVTENTKINWSTIAQCIVAVVAVISLSISVCSQRESRQAKEDASKALSQDYLRISDGVRMPDLPTTITELSVPINGQMVPTGILNAYWQIIVTNNGNEDTWLVEYALRSLGKIGPKYYPGMNQGLFVYKDNVLSSTQVPLLIPTGQAIVIVVGVGLLMEPTSYHLVVDQFGSSFTDSLRNVTDYLASKGVDLYNNHVESDIPGVLIYSSPDSVTEEWFIADFQTSRGLQKIRFLSWYVHSGIPGGRIQ